jgi:hypothetical protein
MSNNTGKIIMFGWKRGGPIQFGKKVSLLWLNVREYQRAIQKWQSREADNFGYTIRNKTKQKHNAMYVEHHNAHTHTHTHSHTHN